MRRKSVITVTVAAVAVLGAATAMTYALGGTESTTALDRYSTETVDGGKALNSGIVAGRIDSKYHPLPWIGKDVSSLACPSALRAIAGTSTTCTATADGKHVTIPVRVLKASDTAITWRFER
jgi:hypothetical protein